MLIIKGIDCNENESLEECVLNKLRNAGIDIELVEEPETPEGIEDSAAVVLIQVQENNTKNNEMIENVERMNSMKKEQTSLMQDMSDLINKYQSLQEKLRQALWIDLRENHQNTLRNIPMKMTIPDVNGALNGWLIGDTIGNGQFGSVHEVRHVQTSLDSSGKKLNPNEFAVKKIYKDRITDTKSVIRVDNEIGTLRRLQHPGVVRFVDVFHTPEIIYIVMERGGTELFEHYRSEMKPKSEEFIHDIASQMIALLSYFEQQKISHRDIKPENILIDKNGKNLKVIDFGLSIDHRDDLTKDDFCGTPGFFAPECILQRTYSCEKLDVFGLGCVLLEMLLGPIRFREIWMSVYSLDNIQEPIRFVQDMRYALRCINYVFDHSCTTARIGDLCVDNTCDLHRTKIEMACNKAKAEQPPRSSACIEFIWSLLELSPETRALASDALCHDFVADSGTRTSGMVVPKLDSPRRINTDANRRRFRSSEALPTVSKLYGRRMTSSKSKLPLIDSMKIETSVPSSETPRDRLLPLVN